MRELVEKPRSTTPAPAPRDSRNEGVPGSSPGVGSRETDPVTLRFEANLTLSFSTVRDGNVRPVRIGTLGIVYLVVGIIVAAMKNYFDNVGTALRIVEALLAVLLWPLVLLGIHINLS